MALVLTIDDAKVTEYHVDIPNQKVTVQYMLMAGEDKIRRGVAVFWVTLPPELSQDDYQLPPAYAAQLVAIANDASAAIESRLGI